MAFLNFQPWKWGYSSPLQGVLKPRNALCWGLSSILCLHNPCPCHLAEAKIGDEPKGDGSVAYSPPVWDPGTSKKFMGSNPRVMTQWYSPCLGPWDLKKVMDSNPRLMAQWHIAPVWNHGFSKRVVGSNPRVMAQWYSPCLGPWDLKKVYGFKPKGDGSVV